MCSGPGSKKASSCIDVVVYIVLVHAMVAGVGSWGLMRVTCQEEEEGERVPAWFVCVGGRERERPSELEGGSGVDRSVGREG